jgi:hypothetical protein
MGDVISLAAKRREKDRHSVGVRELQAQQPKAPPKPQETTTESIEVRIERIRASIVRINGLIQELKEMNHDATDCRR